MLLTSIVQLDFAFIDFQGWIFRLESEDAPLACVPFFPSLTGSGSLVRLERSVVGPGDLLLP